MACDACPSTLPAVTSDYTPKGTWSEVAGMKTYTVGSPADTAILVFYDILGLHNSTLQGADRLAHETGFQVIVPDFFEGKPLPLYVFPPDTDSKRHILDTFRATISPDKHVVKLTEVVRELSVQSGITTWGSFGLCYGGIITARTSGDNTPFKASGTAHPGRPSPEVAKQISIPYICLFSKEDGDPAIVEEYGKILEGKVGCVVEHYSSMHHGWMSARANLKDATNVKEFERGWSQAADFFKKEL